MKKFYSGADSNSFDGADILNLIRQLSPNERYILQRILEKKFDEENQNQMFSFTRNWVLRHTYPDKFSKKRPFYRELEELFLEVN